MLYSLLYPLHESFSVFNVFKYITFRSFGAMMTAMILSLMLGAPFIRWLRAKAIGQSIRELGPESHYSKRERPPWEADSSWDPFCSPLFCGPT